MDDIISRMSAISADPSSYLRQWKEQNKQKIIGIVPMHLPEEIVHASGMLPVLLWESNEPITVAHDHVQPFFCGFIRSLIDTTLKGNLDFLDGMVFSEDMCLAIREMSFVVQKNAPLSFFKRLYLPATLEDPPTRAYMIDEFNKFRRGLAEFAGHEVSDESIRQSIMTYNKNRELLRRLYQLRRTKPGLLPARQIAAIVMSSGLMPKEEHNKLLETLLPELEKKQPQPNNKVRLILSGSLCQAPHVDILNLIEELGGVIVDDDLYIGKRYFTKDAEADADPIESLVNRYLNMEPRCPTKVDSRHEWGDQLMDMLAKNQARGIISLHVKCCEPLLFYYPDLKLKLNAAGVSELMLEVEHEMISWEAIRTRVEAFLESIRRD